MEIYSNFVRRFLKAGGIDSDFIFLEFEKLLCKEEFVIYKNP
jgi:hypothetical protein